MTGPNRRVSKRYHVMWPARLLLPNSKIVTAIAKDISLEGVYIETATGWAKGATVNVELNPFIGGHSFQLRLAAIIVRDMLLSNNRGVGLGMLFKDITADNQKLLVNVIHRLKG